MRCLTTIPLLLLLSVSAYAQPMDIPDPNLRAAIADALNMPHGTPITQEDMRRLTRLSVYNRGVQNLTGLEFATNLSILYIDGNPMITDLSPLAALTQLKLLGMFGIPGIDITPLSKLTNLENLDMAACSISDITPLSNLVNLASLNARYNFIVDIGPLANLTNLVKLRLNGNRITDVTPLQQLARLEFLEIQHNHIADHGPLNALSLSHFIYDQACEMPPLPLVPRLQNRTFPSIFSRWNKAPITNRTELSDTENLSYHDLRWNTTPFALRFFEEPNGFKMAGDLDRALQRRDELHALNPNMIHLVDVGIRAAPLDWFPEDWPYWIRDEHGVIFLEDGEQTGHGLMDFTHPVVQDRIVQQAVAVSKCGLYDGIFFDFWSEDWTVLGGFRTMNEEQRARDIIVQRIRAQTRPNFLIMGNTNDRIIPRTAPLLNGGFLENNLPALYSGIELENKLTRVENSLLWMERNLREPHTNCLEGHNIPTEPPHSPANRRWMRAITTLSLTHSDGYVLFQTEESGHYWYDFWDADLGRPVGAKAQLYDEEIQGLYIREFTNGWAVYNHSGADQTIMLPELTTGVASRLEGQSHTLLNLDGEMYLRAKPVNPADVNGDGAVNILDLTLVARGFGTDDANVDINGDGVVNVFDLIEVAAALGGGGAAPSADSPELSNICAADVAKWLALAHGLDAGDANFQRGIRFLEGLLAALTPKETALLPNYPNPFNPETWIPYRLAREGEVAITIYDTKGTLVRQLALGNQAAGYYAERGKAAYWDGRNERGEAVANGIYIYQFRAGDYAASRRMVILK